MDKKIKLAGALLLASTLQFFVSMFIAQSMLPRYSVFNNYISELGIGQTATLFNTSIILLGLMLCLSALLIFLTLPRKAFPFLLGLTGLCAIGVGLFTMQTGKLHSIFSVVTFILSALAVLSTYKLLKSPLRLLAIICGLITIVAIVLLGTHTFLGLGKGGMERIVVYVPLIYTALFGLYLTFFYRID